MAGKKKGGGKGIVFGSGSEEENPRDSLAGRRFEIALRLDNTREEYRVPLMVGFADDASLVAGKLRKEFEKLLRCFGLLAPV
jgi:hypothetical protein